MSYTSPAQSAANIRAAYKQHGWTSRDVSVRSESYSLGSAVRILIKNGAVPVPLAERIAETEEHIDRDANGDILSGGNRYVSVTLSSEAEQAKAARYLGGVRSGINCLSKDAPQTLQPVGFGYHVGIGQHGWGFALWGESAHLAERDSAEQIALAMALDLEKRAFSEPEQVTA